MWRLYRRDIRQGLIGSWYVLLIPVIVSLMQVNQCHILLSELNGEGLLAVNGTIMDYYMYCMEGMSVYHFDPQGSFSIPICWFTFQIGISYLVAYYAHRDFEEYGSNMIMALHDRRSWWTGKYLWCISSVIVYYIVAFVTVATAAMMRGAELRMNFSEAFMGFLYGRGMLYLEMPKMIIIVFAAPLCITTVICALQIYLGFLLSPIVSFAASCGLYVVSVYYTCWYLIGNYTIWQRSTYVVGEGIRTASGLMLGIGGIVVVYYLGSIYFDTKDVLH